MKKANNLDKRKKINVKDFLKAINFEPHPGQKPIIDAYISGKREIVWVAGRRAGKALDIKTPILTTGGWKTMGDLKEGDYVFGQDGKPTKVSWISDIMYGHKCYNVKFSDGSIIKADAEHQWTVEDKSFRKNTARAENTSCKLKTKTTEELLKDYKILRSDGDFENNYSIKTCSPIEFEEKELPIDPYVFGCWLGDGHSNGSGFTTEDKEFIELFDSRGYELRKGTSKYHYSIYNKEPVRNIRFTTRWSRKITILKQLQELGVIKNKHIPDCYKFASIEQRLELLRGLMDTDGYCDEGGGQEYCGVNKRLCEDVYELMTSLGLKPGFGEHECYLEGRYICQKYRINLTTELRIFNLKRKYERQKESTREWTKRRYIVDIKECESIPVKCIGVENENHLYLAGKNLIATHNSQTLGVIAVMESILAGSKIWVVAPDYSLAERVFNYLLQYVSKIYPDGSYRVTSKPGMSIRFDNGSIVECKSGDNPNSLLGEEVDLLIIDEAAMMSPNVYDRYLFATTAIRKGLTIFISTPNKKNWFFRKYGEVKDNEEGFVFNSPSSINPYVPPEEIERARKSLPEDVFKQEYLAQFLDTGAGVFRGFYDLIGETYDEPWGSHRYVMGADLAKVNDFTVLTVIDKQTHNVVYWERFNGLDWSLVIKKIANIANKYNKAKLIIDSTGVGNPVTEAIKREAEGLLVEEFKFHTKSKKDLIDKLSIFIENRAIRIPDEPDLLDELDCYACEMTEGGTLKYGAPKGKHDDAVTSLALAVWGLNSPDALEDADDLYKINIKNFLLDDDNEEITHRTHK